MEAQPGPRMNPAGRPPCALVAGILVLVIAGLVIAGIILSHRSHPAIHTQAVISPSASIAAVATTSAPAAASPSASGSSSAIASASAAASVAGLAVASTPLEKDIEAAYQKYLDIYSQAALNLDSSHLNDVLAGAALQRVTDEINQLKSQGKPVRIIETKHAIAFAQVTDSSATLIDEYTNDSVYADPQTKQALGPNPQPDRVRQSYVFQKIGGPWQITDGTRTPLPEAS